MSIRIRNLFGVSAQRSPHTFHSISISFKQCPGRAASRRVVQTNRACLRCRRRLIRAHTYAPPLYPSLCPYRCRIRREFNKRRNSLFDSNYLHTTVRTHVGTQWYDNQRHAYVRTRRLQIGNPNYTSSAIRAFVCGIATELLSCGCRYRGYWEHEDFVGRGTHRINRKRK